MARSNATARSMTGEEKKGISASSLGTVLVLYYVLSYAWPDVAIGKHAQHSAQLGDTETRQALVLVEWRDREAFDGFLADPELADLHTLRENGTRRYIWWMFDRIDDLRPLLRT